ncbi:MAG: hypothetical protein KBC91_01355 [Candidatus Omnitrophica bacterium]|nr:hypothetical protein [Candidatus Omnitrophota bacterium]
MRKLTVWTLTLMIAGLAGCIRVSGSAGYWKQGADDEVPAVHEAGFDTANLLPAKTSTK